MGTIQQAVRAPATLDELLYADRTTAPDSEKDWVGLVRSIAAGDQSALRSLYERTHRLVFTLMLRITDNRETAEELTLEVFHGVWQRAAAYDAEDGTVVGWIMNQARSRAIDRVRFEQRKKRVNPYPDEPFSTTRPRSPQDACYVGELAQRMREALKILTPDEREAIEIAFFLGLTHAETAAHLDQPLGTVKTRIRSGLSKLRQALPGTRQEL